MNCKKCGSDISEGLRFCPSCGTEIISETDKTVAEAAFVDGAPKLNASEEEAKAVAKNKKSPIGKILGVLAALALAVVRIFTGGEGGATPKNLEYRTFVYDDGYGYTFTVEYGYKNDIIYTETDTYTYDLTVGEPWTQEEIDMVVAEYDAYALEAEGLECYKYSKTVTDTKLVFVDEFTDLGISKNIKAFADLGWFTFEGGYKDGTLLSMEKTEATLFEEGFTEVK